MTRATNGRAPLRVGSYQAAIDWIAQNDDTAWLDNEEAGSPSVTLALVADVFGGSDDVATADLRRAVARIKKGK